VSKENANSAAKTQRRSSPSNDLRRRSRIYTAARHKATRSTDSKPINVLSLCSGMGSDVAAFELADVPHKLVAVAEIDPAACAVLAHKFPEARNLGDLNNINWSVFHDQEVNILPQDSRASRTRRRGTGRVSMIRVNAVPACSALLPKYIPTGSCSKMSPDSRRRATAARTGARSRGSTGKVIAAKQKSSMPSTCSRNAAVGSGFSGIAELPGPHLLKYSLSPQAAAGVMRRARKNRYTMPPRLRSALTSTIRSRSRR